MCPAASNFPSRRRLAMLTRAQSRPAARALDTAAALERAIVPFAPAARPVSDVDSDEEVIEVEPEDEDMLVLMCQRVEAMQAELKGVKAQAAQAHAKTADMQAELREVKAQAAQAHAKIAEMEGEERARDVANAVFEEKMAAERVRERGWLHGSLWLRDLCDQVCEKKMAELREEERHRSGPSSLPPPGLVDVEWLVNVVQKRARGEY